MGGLIGVHVYVQAYAFAPGVNLLQIIISNGIDWLRSSPRRARSFQWRWRRIVTVGLLWFVVGFAPVFAAARLLH